MYPNVKLGDDVYYVLGNKSKLAGQERAAKVVSVHPATELPPIVDLFVWFSTPMDFPAQQTNESLYGKGMNLPGINLPGIIYSPESKPGTWHPIGEASANLTAEVGETFDGYTETEIGAPVKNKGGRPRKNPLPEEAVAA